MWMLLAKVCLSTAFLMIFLTFAFVLYVEGDQLLRFGFIDTKQVSELVSILIPISNTFILMGLSFIAVRHVEKKRIP